ncbi:uncharacterized protein LOC124178555 [Neodiprion fabricii]|uniref:uncharacterized protein LOC124178555 n=1 Tax=Neodiprion fabricii TaxID=2872261 RepID=UPI001ED90000|nr:uncharacterized protein LOC124178555 [Neodiprion fabricii]
MVTESLEETEKSDWSCWQPKMRRQQKSNELMAYQSSEQLTFADVDAALSSSHHDMSESQPYPSILLPESSVLSNLRRKRMRAATTSTQVNVVTRNQHFAALAQSKLESVELIKADMRAKSAIEIHILKTQLEKEQFEVKLLKYELERKMHNSGSEN